MKKHILIILLLFSTIFFCSVQTNAQCHIDDWKALKALYESTEGNNWSNNSGWEAIYGNSPATNCDLSQLYGVELDQNQRVSCLDLDSPCNDAFTLDFWGGNNLKGKLPIELGLLSNLVSLDLDQNYVEGSIPSELGDLSKLEYFSAYQNQLNGNIPPELGSLKNLIQLNLWGNNLSGNIPPDLGGLDSLFNLNLSHNNLNGSLPTNLGDLGNIRWLNLNGNKLSGAIPDKLSELELLFDFNENYFQCNDITSSFGYKETSQNFTPGNYFHIETNIIDLVSKGQNFNLKIDFPFDTTGLTFQWIKNDKPILYATNANYEIKESKHAGKYKLEIQNKNCGTIPTLHQTSDSMYVIIKGYDLYGQPVQYDQIMVAFDNTEETDKYEREILKPNAGFVQKSCDCNRELYLWQFPSTEAAAKALLEIDRKNQRIKSTTKPTGGFNNLVNVGEINNTSIAYNVFSDKFKDNYPDSVSVYILDSGLDERNHNSSAFLHNQASVDICYDIEMATGYSYIDTTITITTNYTDDLWHGTFGFRSITSGLSNNINLKLVPLKIFNNRGEGNLFDMVCAIYHAIDHNADVINISAGFKGAPSDELEKAINLARQKGIFIVASAGNDTLNIDNSPYYPAYYASQYFKYEISPGKKDSIKYDNVISVSSVGIEKDSIIVENDTIPCPNSISQFSNYGRQSVTIACYGENIHSYGLESTDVVASGSSMATYFATKALALEIAKNKQRNYQQIWGDFKTNWLIDNPCLSEIIQTGKQIAFDLEEAEIYGCTDETNCNYYPFATIEDGSCLPVFINLIDSINQSSNKYHSSGSILSNKVIETKNSKTYKAGSFICLENDFTVEKGAEFIAEIESCD